jgi:uncharacterized protein YciW
VNTLASFDWALAVYVASTIGDDAGRAAELERRLANLGAAPGLLANIRRGAGYWTVSDDDRTDVIVAYAAKLSRAPASVDRRDVERLEAIGITGIALEELDSAVTFVAPRRPTRRSSSRG